MSDLLITKIAAYGEAMEVIGYYSNLKESDPLMQKARSDARLLWQDILSLINQMT